jgi:archaellin
MSSSHTSLILMIVMISITAGGAYIFFEHAASYRSAPTASVRETTSAAATADDLAIVNVVATPVASNNVSYIRIQVRYTGNEKLPLNQTFIQIKTDESTADLHFRNGTLTRSVSNGYYTE